MFCVNINFFWVVVLCDTLCHFVVLLSGGGGQCGSQNNVFFFGDL